MTKHKKDYNKSICPLCWDKVVISSSLLVKDCLPGEECELTCSSCNGKFLLTVESEVHTLSILRGNTKIGTTLISNDAVIVGVGKSFPLKYQRDIVDVRCGGPGEAMITKIGPSYTSDEIMTYQKVFALSDLPPAHWLQESLTEMSETLHRDAKAAAEERLNVEEIADKELLAELFGEDK